MVAANTDISVAEELKLVAAMALGVIHGGIGLLGQGFQVLRVRWVDGDTNAGGQMQWMAVD